MTKEELQKKIAELGDNNPEEVLELRGKLIKTLKETIASTKDYSVKTTLRLELKNELEKHKAHIKKMQATKTYNLPKKVGLKVKEIATTIKLFTEKKDLINKAKAVVTNTAVSSVVVGGITMGLNFLTGGTISLALLASLVPTMSYIGLSNVLRQAITDTPYTSLLKLDDQKEKVFTEAQQFGNDYILNNKEFLKLLLSKSKEKDNNNLIAINENLITKYKEIIKNAPNEKIKQSLTLELINAMQDLKSCLEKKKRAYIKDKEQMSALDYAKLEKRYLQLCADLYQEENFIPDATKNAFKNIKVSAATMYTARLVLSAFFPSLAFDSLKDVVTPFIITVLNNMTNMGEFKNKVKLVNTKYTDLLIKMNKPELFKELRSNKELAMA